MPTAGKQWRDQLSFSEGPWNTVWKLKVRLMYQKEKQCALTLLWCSEAPVMVLDVLELHLIAVILEGRCQPPDADGVRLTWRDS